jgi:ABC-type amino acid transport substrate-binding protein
MRTVSMRNQLAMRTLRLRPLLALVAVACALLVPSRVAAQEAGDAPGAAPRVLRVGTKEAPPFAMRNPETGDWSGLSIELWRQVAADLGLTYELVETDLEGLLDGVADGTLDVGVAALTVTEAREERMDFSHPFHVSGLGIAVRARKADGLWATVRGFLSPAFLQVVLLLALVLAAAGFGVWLFERRRNREEFGDGPLGGLGHAFWWSAVTMTTVGYGDKSPRTTGGRAVALVWMFASVIIISSFTAAIASSLTVARLELPVEGPDDLPRVTVATVPGSTSDTWLQDNGIRRRELPTVAAALDAVADGEVPAVVYDAPILRYLVLHAGDDHLQVLPKTFEPQSYAFALPGGSPLREPINRALLAAVRSREQQARLERYLGS